MGSAKAPHIHIYAYIYVYTELWLLDIYIVKQVK
jgi:hypothetical protein